MIFKILDVLGLCVVAVSGLIIGAISFVNKTEGDKGESGPKESKSDNGGSG